MPKPLGGWGSVAGNPILVTCAGLGCARRLCQGRRAGARCAGVVRPPVVRNARCAQPDRVLGVVLMEARGAGVIACRCGTRMPGAGEPAWPAHPTRPCSRPLRARDRLLFDTLCVARLRRLMGKPLGGCDAVPPQRRVLMKSYRTQRPVDKIAHDCASTAAFGTLVGMRTPPPSRLKGWLGGALLRYRD